MSIVSLVSGGIDSLVMAKIIDRQNEKQIPLFIDYGQLASEREWNACNRAMKLSCLQEPLRVTLEGYGHFFPTGLTDAGRDIKKDAFLPGRNLLFLLVASSLAYTKNVDKVAIGLLSDKYSIFPDQTQQFIVNANVAINSALNTSITIVTPLIMFGKADVMRLAENLGLPLAETYSCHSGEEKYCGKCVACEEIAKSGLADILPQFRRKE